MENETTVTPEIADASELIASWLAERPDLNLDNFLLGIVVNRLGRMLEASFDRTCRAIFGISGPDIRVILALRRQGAPYTLRPTDLYRKLLVTSGAMTKQVDRLAALGLVERMRDPDYAAGFRIRLTSKGVKLANDVTEEFVRNSFLGDALEQIPAEMIAPGKDFLYRLLGAFEAIGKKG